jgi:WD40 repeat protein/Flp pilus assembly protein TadD
MLLLFASQFHDVGRLTGERAMIRRKPFVVVGLLAVILLGATALMILAAVFRRGSGIDQHASKLSAVSAEARMPDAGWGAKPRGGDFRYRKSWAVVIGIDNYPGGSGGLGRLKCAVNDAMSIKEILIEDFGYTQEGLRLLTDREATRTAIQNVVQRWPQDQDLQENDSILVFFSGHGLIDKQTDEGYLAAVDSKADDLTGTCIPVSWIKDQLDRLPCSHKLMILDSCYSGALFAAEAGQTGPTAKPDGGPPGRGNRGILSRDSASQTDDSLAYYLRNTAFFGMSAGRIASVADGPSNGHSVFTASLLQSLREQGNSMRADHAFTFRTHVAPRVEDLVSNEPGSRQHPNWGRLGPGDGDFIFRPTMIRMTPREESETRLLERQFTEADSVLTKLRQLRQGPGRPDARREMKRLADQIVASRKNFDAGVQRLGGPARTVSTLGELSWNKLEREARNEVTPWMAAVTLRQGRTVSLPAHYSSNAPVRVAIHSDENGEVAEIAVLASGEEIAFLLSADGKERNRLVIPKAVARVARTVSKVTKPSLSRVTTLTNYSFPAQYFAYTAPDRLEYQVGEQVVSWDLKTRQMSQEKRPVYSNPHASRWRIITANDRYEASVLDSDTTVVIRRWSADSKPVVVWRAAGGDPAGGGERIASINFGPDGRSLFILSNLRLALVDAETCATAEATLADDPELQSRDLIPCAEGTALLELRTAKAPGPPRLTFWNATLPLVRMRSLHHDAAALCVSAEGQGDDHLVVVGTADQLVRAWKGPESKWESGLPYLGQSEDRSPEGRRRTQAGRYGEGSTLSVRSRSYGPTGEPGTRRHVTERTGSAPASYTVWEFLPGTRSDFLFQSLERQQNGTPRPFWKVYSAAQDGHGIGSQPNHVYPPEGLGRLLVIDPHLRWGVCVTERDDNFETLDVVSLNDNRTLGRLGRYALADKDMDAQQRLPVQLSFVTGIARSEYLLLARPLVMSGGAALEIWRISNTLDRVGHLFQPDVFGGAFPTDNEGRAIVWRTRFTSAAPHFGEVIDLSTAQRISRLEGFGAVGSFSDSVMTSTHYVFADRPESATDPNASYRVYAWDLKTGRKTPLDDRPWSSDALPQIEASPDGKHVAVCGSLLQTNEAHLRLYNLADARLVGKPLTQRRPATIRVPRVSDSYCVVALDDFPAKGQSRTLRLHWSDGSAAPQESAAEVISARRPVLGACEWLLWRDDDGLLLQDGRGGDLIRLKQSERLAKDTGWLTDHQNVVWPKLRGSALALNAPDGGVWRSDTGERVFEIPAGSRFLRLDDDHRWALTSEASRGEVVIWDVTGTGGVARRCRPCGPGDRPIDPDNSTLKLSPDGRCLAVMSHNTVQLWDVETNRALSTLPKAGHSRPARCIAQHAGTNQVASGDDDGVIMMWSRQDGQLRHILPAHADPISSLTFRSSDGSLASASAAGAVVLRNPDGKLIWSEQIQPATPITQLAFHPKEAFLCIGTLDGRVLFLNAATGRPVRTLPAKSDGVRAQAVSPDGEAVAAGTDGGIKLWRGDAMEPQTWATDSPVSALAFLDDGRLLASGGHNVQFWESDTGHLLWELEVSRGPVRALNGGAAATELVVVDQGTDVSIFNLPSILSQLEGLSLGFRHHPASGWPASAPAETFAIPGLAAWSRRAAESFEHQDWDQLRWFSTFGHARWPKESRFEFYLGTVSSREPSSWREAERWFSNVLESHPENGRTWQALGDLREAQVLAAMRQEISPTAIRAILHEAYKAYGLAIKNKISARRLAQKRGLIAFRLGDHAQAESDLTQALDLMPDDCVSLHLRGRIRAEQGDRIGADRDLSALARLMPYEPRVLREHALARLLNGDESAFQKVCSQMLERIGTLDDVSTGVLVTRTCSLAPMTAAGVETCLRLAERAVRAEPGNPMFLYVRAAVLYRAGRSDEAVQQLNAAIQLNQGRALPQNCLLLALIHGQSGKPQEAKKARENAVQAERLEPPGRWTWDVRVELNCLREQLEKVLVD